MSSEVIKFIVLHSFRHKESGIVVKGYSQRSGITTLYLKSAAGSKRHTISLIHPLSILEITTGARRFGEMASIKEFSSCHKLTTIRSNFDKISIALFISEIVGKTIIELEPNRAMYDFLESSILELENGKEGVANYHLFFLVKYAGMLGYLPDTSEEGILFDIPSASYGSINNGEQFGIEESKLLWQLCNLSVENLGSIAANGGLRSRFLSLMLKYLSFHTGYEIECNSPQILHEVFIK